jgi:hypothetical protein
MRSEAQKSQWHVTRDIHKLALKYVAWFLIIKSSKCYFLNFLKSLFVEFASNLDANTSIDVEPYSLESRLLKTFPKKINVVTMNGKKIVKPYNGMMIENDLDLLEEEDILDRAVLILRKRIRNIERRRLPDDLTTDALLKGE